MECAICSGRRRFCIHKSYPLPAGFDVSRRIEPMLKQEFFGPSSSVFIGSFGYPNVRAGPLAALEPLPDLENPAAWVGKSYAEIIMLRSLLLRSQQMAAVSERSRFVAELQELALAARPADTELRFAKKPFYRFTVSEALQPMGPTAELERMRVAENVRVAPAVERVVGDELKAAEAGAALYQAGEDVYKITAILSSGALGLERKLVPTRWSITATDDIVAKSLLTDVRSYRELEQPLVGEARFMDNHLVQVLLPGSWEFENFETWVRGSTWYEGSLQGGARRPRWSVIEEHEPFAGRTGYAAQQAGGYYASRLAAVELLHRLKRQARVLVFREVGDGYTIPLGVWVVRETARRAAQQLQRFAGAEQALAHARSRLRVPWEQYRTQSRILGRRSLAEFLKQR